MARLIIQNPPPDWTTQTLLQKLGRFATDPTADKINKNGKKLRLRYANLRDVTGLSAELAANNLHFFTDDPDLLQCVNLQLKNPPKTWDISSIHNLFAESASLKEVKKMGSGENRRYRIRFDSIEHPDKLIEILQKYGNLFYCTAQAPATQPAHIDPPRQTPTENPTPTQSGSPRTDENVTEDANRLPPPNRPVRPDYARVQRLRHRIDISQPNNGYRYYRTVMRYGLGMENDNFQALLRQCRPFFDFRAPGFKLVTTYPGLLVGAGYAHPKLKESQEDFQIGFFFDHTTGLPVIPGSSVKGLLRSVAPIKKDDPLKEAKKAYMQTVYECDETLIEKFCNCFDDQTTRFYDAYPVATEDEKGRLFADDYITPHGDNLTQEPNPIRFLKIRPGVTFHFQFEADRKLIDLFKEILLDRGIGAKTNVGYGQWR